MSDEVTNPEPFKYTIEITVNDEKQFAGVYPSKEKAANDLARVEERLVKWFNGQFDVALVPIGRMRLRELIPNPYEAGVEARKAERVARKEAAAVKRAAREADRPAREARKAERDAKRAAKAAAASTTTEAVAVEVVEATAAPAPVA